ncbi:MAG: zinc ABC transporter solute-binding protein [Gammaproteobacteria bacterium]|nr:zinc ABC transporter solute-binding protein [Gammaproteobacteria bacterium]
MNYLKLILATTLVLPFVVARADLNVFACEPEWAALAAEIGAENVTTYSATTALQDPHYIQARPSLIAKVRRADIVICSGAQLEIGWLPLLLQKANNRKILPGTEGYVEASSLVKRIDTTTNVDRARGDIHPMGNPHVQTNPRNISVIATELTARMMKLDVANAPAYQTNYNSFARRWSEAIERWEQQALPLKNKRAITHHNSWVYLARWLGIEVVANLEEIPGVPPTAGHLSTLVNRFDTNSVDFIIRSPYQDVRASKWLAERTGITAIELPLTVGGTTDATNLFTFFDAIIERLLAASNDLE